MARHSFAQERDVALHKPAFANSEDSRYPAGNVTDGKITRASKWMPAAGVQPPHILEINLQKYCNIDRIVVHTGIPEGERTAAEAGQAAGFWSAKNFKLQYWDDANWTDIPSTEVHENRLTDVPFTFSPAINTFKLRFVCDDGEPVSLMEIEAFGTETDNIPVAGNGGTDLLKKTERTADQDVAVTISHTVAGKTMKYVGYNQGYYVPGSNTSGWLEYAGVNSLRVWTTLNSYVPAADVDVDKDMADVQEFDRRKAELRASPERNRFIRWDALLPLYGQTEKTTNTNPMILGYVLSELKRLKIDPVLEIGSTDFDDTWSNKWKQWQRFYALAFYAAKTGDVTMFAMQNEPNHKASGPMPLDRWIGGMQIVSDALTCAVEDAGRLYGKNLKARMVGPVTAGNNPEWWTAVAKSMRTDYHGKTLDHDLLGLFDTHSYNSPAGGYVRRVADIRKLLSSSQPGGEPLPVVYTEIGRWMNAYLIDKEETMDDPSLFTEWGGIYANNTRNGVYGMWAFKFSNTASESYPLGIKSGHHFTWQGSRIVEDAYTDLAKDKPVKASAGSQEWPARFVTDGDKSDRSAWHSDSASGEKWLEIDLGGPRTLGSAVVYTGSAHGIYTSPDRVKSFSLQYFSDNGWKDIPGFTEKENKYAQVFGLFKQPVTTDKVRFVSTDPGVIKVREIKVFAAGDGPAPGQYNYDISGIQRTGEVVHLFAKGFKDEHPLYRTDVSVKDENLDALTSYDEASGNYYVWLVQRGSYKDKLSLDMTALHIAPGTPVTAESVGPETYGEVTGLLSAGNDGRLNILLPPRTVMLLTVPSGKLKEQVLRPVADATVSGGKEAGVNAGRSKELLVALDASTPENNKVSFIRFDLSGRNMSAARRILLKVHGHNAADTAIFRFHVYGMPADEWDQQKITWRTAPQLDDREALIKEVGQKAFVAGEMAMKGTWQDHYLDVTDLVKRHGAKSVTFALVRETRQMGDDGDKGKKVVISSSESDHAPELECWFDADAGAVTYYINSRWGNDANSGRSKETAWKTCSNLEKNRFLPGDSILFAKGSSYTGGFLFNSSGAPGEPIVFSNYSAGADMVASTPREKLEDVFIRNGAGPLPAFTNPDWNTLNGNIFQIHGSYIIVDGLYFHDNTNPPGSDHTNKNVQKMGAIYLALGTHHDIVRHCEFFHSPVGIKIKGSYNLITHNYLHDATDTLAHSWGPIAIMVVKPHNEICYNRVVNYGSYGGPYGSDGGVVELDGVDDDFEGRDVNIHHNVSINNHGFLELAGRDVDSIIVAYNVSDDNNQFIGGGSMKNILIYNNTVVRLREPNVDRYVFWTFHPDSSSVSVRNNIFVTAKDISVFGPFVKAKGHVRSRLGNQPHDHNLYFSPGNADPIGTAAGKGDIIADPLFVDYADGNLRLQENSPAKNKGIKLGYSRNLDDYAPDQKANPDIGAY